MKRIKLVSLGLVVSLAAAIGLVGSVSATWSPNLKATDDAVVVKEGDTHTGSLYVAGDTVTVDGTIKGSLYCGASTVTINGTVEGDVLCAGQKITINGTVGQDARLAGQFVEVEGNIGGTLTAFAQDVRLAADASVAGDINGAAQRFVLNGSVGRDIVLGAQSLVIGGEVKGNVDVGVEQLRLESGAAIVGNLNYGAETQQTIDAAKVQGTISFNQQTHGSQASGEQLLGGMRIIFLLALAVSAMVVALIMPRFVHRSGELYSRQALLTTLLGFAFVFGGPIVVVLLLMTVVLAPLGLTLLFGWLAVLFLSGIFFAYWVGAELLRSQPNILVRMLGGVVIVLIAYSIPVLNVLTLFAAGVVGSGMIIATLTNGYKRPQYQVVAKKPAASK